MLTHAQVEQYRTDGLVVVPDLLNAFTRQRMKDALAQWVEQSRAVDTHTQVFDLESGHSASEPRLRRIKQPHKHPPVFEEFIRSEPMLAVLRDLLGPGLRSIRTRRVPRIRDPRPCRTSAQLRGPKPPLPRRSSTSHIPCR